MPASRRKDFETNVARARSLIGLGQSIASMTAGAVDPTDMYRSALVQSVAAIDTYVHGVVFDHALAIAMGRRQTAVRGTLGLGLGPVAEVLAAASAVDRELLLSGHLKERLSRETFQRPEAINDALALVGVSKAWTTAFGQAAETEKTGLRVVVARRNKIVHECDADPLNIGQTVPLTEADAIDAVERAARVVAALDAVV